MPRKKLDDCITQVLNRLSILAETNIKARRTYELLLSLKDELTIQKHLKLTLSHYKAMATLFMFEGNQLIVPAKKIPALEHEIHDFWHAIETLFGGRDTTFRARISELANYSRPLLVVTEQKTPDFTIYRLTHTGVKKLLELIKKKNQNSVQLNIFLTKTMRVLHPKYNPNLTTLLQQINIKGMNRIKLITHVREVLYG